MRLALIAIAMTTTAASAQASPAGDRYGPRDIQAPPASPAASAYAGPMLGWSRKVAPTAPVASAPAGYAPPRRLPGGLYAGPQAPPVQVARVAPPPAPQALAPQTLAPAALPDSLYSRPEPQAAPQAAPRPNPYASRPRFYSVYREYGGAPDPIPAPTQGPTWASRPEASLIDPVDPPKKGEDRMASEGDGDWGAMGGGGLLGGDD